MVVERAGFEPAYACAGRFTVCYDIAEIRQEWRAMYHLCIGGLAEQRLFRSSG